MEEAVQTNPRGGAAGGRPPRRNLRAQETAHAPVRETPPSTSGAWGRGGAWLARGRGSEEDPEAGPRGGGWEGWRGRRLGAVTSGAAGAGDYPLLLT